MMRRPILPVLPEVDDLPRLRAMTDDERAADLVGLMRAAAQLLAVNENRDRILPHREPLAPATQALLARLRARKRSRTP
jgi:hypothetical protein